MTKNAATTIPPTWAAPAGQPAGIAGQGITAVAVDPTNANQVVVVYPGFSGVNALLNPSRHVFMTTDDGTTWSDISGVSQGGTNNLLIYRSTRRSSIQTLRHTRLLWPVMAAFSRRETKGKLGKNSEPVYLMRKWKCWL